MENWPPYRWLYTHVVLARDGAGNPIPYTHGLRANYRVWVPVFAALVVLVLAYWGTRKLKLPLWVLLLYGFICALAAHAWW